jgi:hypothetical protein
MNDEVKGAGMRALARAPPLTLFNPLITVPPKLTEAKLHYQLTQLHIH